MYILFIYLFSTLFEKQILILSKHAQVGNKYVCFKALVMTTVNNFCIACLTSVLSTLKQYTLLQIKTHNTLVQTYAK